jgi:hypothetical protein
MGISGFYRGFNNKYKDNSIFNYGPTPLYVDRTIYGLLSIGYYLNPMFHPYIYYYTIKRTEKRIRNLEIKNEDWEW